MLMRIFAKGHGRVLVLHTCFTVVLISLLSGILSVALAATTATSVGIGVPPTTAAIQKYNNDAGIATYSFLVFAIAAVVSIFLMNAACRFVSFSVKKTVASLRIYGLSKSQIRRAISLYVGCIVGVGLLGGWLGAIAVALLYCALLRNIGLDVSGLSDMTNMPALLVLTLCVGALTFVVLNKYVFMEAGRDTSTRASRPVWQKKLMSVVQGVAVVIFVFLIFYISRIAPTVENINGVSFSLLLVAIGAVGVAIAFILPWTARLCMRRGASHLIFWGMVRRDASQLSLLALIAALFISLTGVSTQLTLSSEAAGQYLAVNSLNADAVADGSVRGETSGDVITTAFNVDTGWMNQDSPENALGLIAIDPGGFESMFDPESIVSGALQDISGDNVIASASRYEIGDEITLIDDAGNEITLTVATLSSGSSIFGNSGIGMSVEAFRQSAGDHLSERTYARADGGIDQIKAELPMLQWESLQEYVDNDIAANKYAKVLTVISMVGGVSFALLAGLMYSLLFFFIDRKRDYRTAFELGFGEREVRIMQYGLTGLLLMLAFACSVTGIYLADQPIAALLRNIDDAIQQPIPWKVIFLQTIVAGVFLFLITMLGSHMTMSRQQGK